MPGRIIGGPSGRTPPEEAHAQDSQHTSHRAGAAGPAILKGTPWVSGLVPFDVCSRERSRALCVAQGSSVRPLTTCRPFRLHRDVRFPIPPVRGGAFQPFREQPASAGFAIPSMEESMSVSTRNTSSTAPVAACAPFSGLGHATEAVVAVAAALSPRRESVPVAERPVPRPVGVHGYALQCRLCRETRAG